VEVTKVKEDTRTRGITKTRGTIRTSIMNITTKVNSTAIGGSSIMIKGEAGGATTIDGVKTVMERRMRDPPRGKVGTIKPVAGEVTTNNKIKRAWPTLQEDQPGRKGQSV
jgi:hypothetical protein